MIGADLSGVEGQVRHAGVPGDMNMSQNGMGEHAEPTDISRNSLLMSGAPGLMDKSMWAVYSIQ